MPNLAFHVSDIHIFNTSRFQEQKEVFEELIKLTEKIKPRFVSICGDLFHSQLILSPESYFLAKFLISELSKITKVIIIPGNHDVNLSNLKRMDGITSFINELNPEKVFYYKDSGIYDFEDDIVFGAFSIADKKYPTLPDTSKRKIALYHGTLAGSINYFGFKFENARDTIKIFDGWDIAMCGDIHEMQYLDKEKRIAFSGSLKQMNHGEGKDKGILIWNLDDCSSVFFSIKNNYSFHKISSNEKIEELNFTKYVNLIYNSDKKLSHSQKAEIHKRIIDRATQINSNILSYKYEDSSTEELVAYNEEIENIYSLNTQLELLKEFLIQKNYSEKIINECLNFHQELFNEIIPDELKVSSWTIDNIEFENLFVFKDKNSLNIKNFKGLVGIFGNNTAGKSSIFSVIKYAIWGESTNKSDLKNILNYFSTESKSKITLNIDSVIYQIERKIKKSEMDVYSSSVTINNLSNPDDVRCKGGKNEMKKFISETFGTPQEFHDTAFSSQFQIHSIVFTKPAPRKQLFIDFLGLGIFADFLNLIKKDFSDLEYKIKSFPKEKILLEYQEIQKNVAIKTPILSNKSTLFTEMQNNVDLLIEKISNKKSSIKVVNDVRDSEELIKKNIELLINQKSVNQKSIENFVEINIDESLESNLQNFQSKLNELNKKETKIQLEVNGLLSSNEILKSKLENIKVNTKIIDKQEWFRDNDLCQKCDFLSNAFSLEKQIPDLTDKISNNDEIIKNKLELQKAFEPLIKKVKAEIDLIDLRVRENRKYILEKQSINLLKEKNENIQYQINELNNQLRLILENKEILEKNKLLTNEITILENELYQLKEKKKVLNNEIDSIKVELKFNSDQLAKINEKISEFQITENKFETYNAYSSAMEREGLPKLIMLKYINLINQKANRLLSEVVDWRIRLISEGDNLEIKVEEESGFSPPAEQNASGMQVTLIGLAIRVALLTISQKIKCKILFLDEPLGSLDSETVHKIENVFVYLKTLFPTIMMISHVTIYDVCDNILLLEKNQHSTKLTIN